jgi:amino acid transporter
MSRLSSSGVPGTGSAKLDETLELTAAALAGLEMGFELGDRLYGELVLQVRPHPADGFAAINHRSSSSIPKAFESRGLAFAGAYVSMQVGRTLFFLWAVKGRRAMVRNFQRILAWLALAGVFWIAGALAHDSERLALWLIALGLEFVSPSLGFWVPVLGRSTTADWNVEGGHMSERCALFIIIALGVYGALSVPAAQPITTTTVVPSFSDFSSINLLATIAFAFAGLELASTMGDEVVNPRRNLPAAVFISAPLIALAYILGTASVLWLVPNTEINIVSGFLQAIVNGSNNLGPSFWWLAPLCAALFTIGNIGGVGAWLTGPARVAFVIGLDRYFPKGFGRVHPRWHTPYVAILVQAILATVFLLLSVLGRGTTVEDVYLILLDTQILIYFIPYIYLFVVFMLHRFREVPDPDVILAPGGKAGALATGISGLAVTLLAMGVATIPPRDTADPLLFRLKVIGGALAFVGLGGLIYWRARRQLTIRL